MNETKNTSRRMASIRLTTIAGSALGLGTLPRMALAQGNWPDRPVTIVCPFGGAVDTLAR